MVVGDLVRPGQPNSIGFLRFWFAALVLFSHCYVLGGFGADPFVTHGGQDTLGGIGVSAFFTLSGFLVSKSFVASGTVTRFVWHRALRILPGFWACLVICAVVFGPLMFALSRPGESLTHYVGAATDPPWRFVIANSGLFMFQPGIDGLLSGMPSSALDGSLWSLSYEGAFYVAVALFGVLGLFTVRERRGVVVIGALVIASSMMPLLGSSASVGLVRLATDPTITHLAACFLTGMLFYLFRERIPLTLAGVILCGVLTVVALFTPFYLYGGSLPMAYVFFYAARALPLSWWDRRGDVSYGLYMYAFPVQQTLVLCGVQHVGPLRLFCAAIGPTLVLAWLSYRFVERPAMKWKNRFGARDRSMRGSTSTSE